MKVRRTRMTRVLVLWAVLFLLTIMFVAVPTGFGWGYWVYGLVWGAGTATVQYLFPKVFEEELEV